MADDFYDGATEAGSGEVAMTIKTFVESFGKGGKSDPGAGNNGEALTGPRPRTRRRRSHLTPLEIVVDDASRRAASGDWAGAKGGTLVGLYALCHRMVYGVLPGELEQVGLFRQACKQAASLMHELFSDDASAVAAFVRWSWEREKRRNAWAQSKQIERNRLGWRAQFSRALETDYRVASKQRR